MTTHDNANFTDYRVTTDDQPIAAPAVKTATRTLSDTPKRGRGPRWAWIGIAGGAVLVVGAGVLVFDALSEPSPPAKVEYTTSQRLVQESIDEALAERSTVEAPSTGTATRFELPNGQVLVFDADAGATEYTTSQRLVQESIDEALAERTATQGELPAHLQQFEARVDSQPEYTTSQRLVQESIDDALAERTATQFELPNGQVLVFDADAGATEYTTSQRLVQESIDEALAANGASVESGTGAVASPGLPDGYWQSNTSASPVGAPECNYSGPC